MVNGVSSILHEKVDGGFLQNIWYDTVIIVRRHSIQVKFNRERDTKVISHDYLDLIFDVEDRTLVKGAVGWGVNGLS